MATTPSVPNQLNLQFVAQNGDHAIVRINNQNYRLTVTKGSNGAWTNITGTRDWTAVATQAAEIFFAHQQQPERKIDEGNVILTGDLQDIESNARQRNVTLVSARYKVGAEVKNIQATDLTTDTLNVTTEQKAIITQKLTTLGQELATIRPASSSPSPEQVHTPQSAPPNPPSQATPPGERWIDVEKDERVEVCKDRAKLLLTEKTPEAALASQLINMNKIGSVDYSAQTPAVLGPLLRDEVSRYIVSKEAKESYWQHPAKFTEVFKALQHAYTSDNAALSSALVDYNRIKPDKGVLKKVFASKKNNYDVGALGSLINKDPSAITAERKALVYLYSLYLRKPEAKIQGPVFFRAFVDMHSGDKNANFQIVLIEKTATNTEKATAITPYQEPRIDTKRCAFLYVEKNASGVEEYHSYDRKPSLGNPRDLNQPSMLTNQPTTERQRVTETASLPIQTVDSSGRCLDKSLAYLILSKRSSVVPSSEISTIADQLRSDAKNKIKDAGMNNDVLFLQSLKASISHIPAFSTEARYNSQDGNRLKLASKELITRDLLAGSADRFDEISRLLTIDVATLTNAQRQKLQDLYGDYVDSGAKNQQLDSAFLYVLPQINIDPFNAGIKCAVIQDGKIRDQYPGHVELNVRDWLYVVYNGSNHYDIINMDTGRATLEAIIKQEKKKILDDFLQKLRYTTPPTSPDIIKTDLWDRVGTEHPQAFKAFAMLVYDKDLASWNSAPQESRGTQPGTESIEAFDATPEGYGRAKLYALGAAELKTLLQSFSNEQILQKLAGLNP